MVDFQQSLVDFTLKYRSRIKTDFSLLNHHVVYEIE